MEITENLAVTLRSYKSKQRLSMTEMAEQLEIANSTLQDYLAGKGNPRIKTIEHIASKMGMDSNVLIANSMSNEQLETILSLLETFSVAEQLSCEKKKRFIQLFAEMLFLWDDEKKESDL